MRILLVFVSFIISGALCFYAGLKVGESQQASELASALSSTEEVHAYNVEDLEADSDDYFIADAPDEQVMSAVDASAGLPTVEEMRVRAAEKIIKITDKQGRVMEVEVLDSSERGLRVRRQVDYLAVIVPLDVLSPADRAFAEFLRNTPEGSPSAPTAAVAKSNEISDQDKKLYELIFGKPK